MSYSLLLPEVLLTLTLVAALFVDLFVKEKRIVGYLTLFGLTLTFVAILNTIGTDTTSFFGGVLTIGSFSQFFKLVVIPGTILCVLGAMVYLKDRPYMGEHYLLLMFATLGIMFVASATELVTLFVSWELTSISTYVLAGYLKDKRSSEAAMKYFIVGSFSAALLLFGMSLLYGSTGTTNLLLAKHVVSTLPTSLALLSLIFMIAGFGFELTAVPFHMWVPDTYEGAPTTVSAFIAICPKAMAFAAAFRVIVSALAPFQVEWALVFGLLAIVTMTLGNVVALAQENMKRMLAYSSIGHAGYILIAFAVANDFGIAGGLLHLLANVFMKGGAFLAAALVAMTTMAEDIRDYAGLNKRAPITAFAFTMLLFSLIGIPPLAGFISKFVLVMSAINAGGWKIWLAVALILNSALSVWFYVRVIKYMYVVPSENTTRVKEPIALVAALVISVVATFAIGLYPNPFVEFAMRAAREIL
jgi:NADH-quinone oxidoreductase subunit N